MMGPLDNIRVIEVGHALAGPMAATFLGDFGADVIKIERRDGGDSHRTMGPRRDGVGIWWLVVGRNKKSLTLDLKKEEGRRILLDLVRDADVLVENYRPGVLEGLSLGWSHLQAVNPRLVMLRISGFGQTGPYRERGGYGKIAEAFCGATNLTGYRGQPPVHPGYSLADAVCALAGAYGVSLALLARQRSGTGQVVDLALYEPLFRLIEWQIPLHVLQGLRIERNGPQFPFTEAFVTDICRTKDGDNVVVSAATRDTLERLAALMREEDLVSGSPSTEELGAALRAWILRNDRDVVLKQFEERKLVAGLVYTPAEMLSDSHMQARKNIVEVEHPVLGSVPMPGVVPTLLETPGAVRWAGPALGQHTDAILRDYLGYDAQRIADLKSRGVV